ncbi:MAG: 4'-phosphopantetheinyl transferase superfamily protein [Oscillospiraceae bacterium]|nr:4'-phosphopantetheinyl transferase superfamily protein [Oscillospiraceae bacterium]
MNLYICEDVKNAKWREDIPDDKKLSSAFMKRCIRDFTGEKEPEIFKDEYGKPYARDSVCFSLSHSENMMICAVAQFNIGADCQKRSIENLQTCKKIAARFYAEQENAFLDSILKRPETKTGRTKQEAYIDNFFSIWAKKEAYIKYTGKGMAEGLNTFSTAKKNQLGGARFKKIYSKNSKKNNFYIYLCYNKENKNVLQIKYFD